MILLWRTDQPHPNSSATSEWIYNGLDSCVTLEVLEAILPQLNEITQPTYNFERALQAPILEMECRGVRIDQRARSAVIAQLESERCELSESLDEILSEGIGVTDFNPSSHQQVKELLYGTLGLPPVRSRGQITSDRKALEKLRGNFYAGPIISSILALRDNGKKLGTLRTGIDPDGRMRTSYNIAGTDTGRLSSYGSAFGTGTNLQNITEEIRRIFVADPGMKMAYIDLEQAESRAVGAIIWNLFQDGTYLDFCESGDLHTNICKMAWPEINWTEDQGEDKILSGRRFYRDFSYRDASKRLGHASNYRGQPPHISKEVRIPIGLVQEFQRNYFRSFPGIPRWHDWVRTKLIRDGWITAFMGRQRWFFGRRWEDETVRAAVAYEPQSAIADYLNRGMLQVWQAHRCQLLLQVHDAILIQYPEESESEIVPMVQSLLQLTIPLMNGRTLRIPTEASVGWNWGKESTNNVDGLVHFTGHDSRQRSTPPSLMDRVVP